MISKDKSGPGPIQRLMQGSLVTQIVIGLLAGTALAWFSKSNALAVGLLGELLKQQ